MMAQHKVRRAVDGDAEAITKLVNAAFIVERFFIDRDRIDAVKVREMMGTGAFLLIEDGEKLLACVYVEIRGERAYFGLLAVDPARQGEGLGRRMMLEAEGCARAAGCSFGDLRVVNLRTQLPPFYRRLGYVETRTEPFAAAAEPNQPCHFIVMSKELLEQRTGGMSSR
jgi:GNAT superfamily N-acetyltransferase